MPQQPQTGQLETCIKLISEPSDQNLGQMLESLLNRFSAERGCIWIEENRNVVFRGSEELMMSYPFSREVVLAAVKTRLGFMSFDAVEDDRLEPTESIMATQIRSCLCAPARDKDGHVLAVIYFDDKTSRGVFTEEDFEFVVTLMSNYPGAV